MRVLLLGGSGHFGARIFRRLARDIKIEVIAPRHSVVDITSPDLASIFGELDPDVVLHAAGPYQGQDYVVARACVEAGCHYVDLADGREFVSNFSSLDAAARTAGVTLISGASTLPGISSSVVEAAKARFTKIDSIETSIAPAHKTSRGVGTIAAVLSYCGQPFTMLRDDDWDTVYGWQDLRVQRYPGFRSRLSAVCDVPDLELMPLHVPGLRTATFHAALEAPWEQLSLWCMAWLSRLGLVRDWVQYAPAVSSIGHRLMGFGTDRGGMHIRMTGSGPGDSNLCVDWYVVALSNHGPEIPCTPSIVVTKKLLSGEISKRGAFACWNRFSIEELLEELADFDVTVHEKEAVN